MTRRSSERHCRKSTLIRSRWSRQPTMTGRLEFFGAERRQPIVSTVDISPVRSWTAQPIRRSPADSGDTAVKLRDPIPVCSLVNVTVGVLDVRIVGTPGRVRATGRSPARCVLALVACETGSVRSSDAVGEAGRLITWPVTISSDETGRGDGARVGRVPREARKSASAWFGVAAGTAVARTGRVLRRRNERSGRPVARAGSGVVTARFRSRLRSPQFPWCSRRRSP